MYVGGLVKLFQNAKLVTSPDLLQAQWIISAGNANVIWTPNAIRLNLIGGVWDTYFLPIHNRKIFTTWTGFYSFYLDSSYY